MDEELPRVTAGLLRRASDMCPRRLNHEYSSNSKPSALGNTGFEVLHRIQGDATTGHADPSVPLAQAFVEPADLDHEQRALYRAAARGYLRHFGDRAVVTEDLEFATELPDAGVRLVGPIGIGVRDEHGDPELRILRIGASARLLDDVDMRFIVLRAAEWAPRRLRVVVVDLVNDDSSEYELDIEHEFPAALEWLRERVAVIDQRADHRSATIGRDCAWCPCIPGCPKLT